MERLGGRAGTRRNASRRSARPGSEAVRKNRRFWDRISDAYERSHTESLRTDDGEAWGFWRIPEREIQLLGPIRGRRVLELGCGAARWSIALRRRGARPVGLDVSGRHLRHAVAEMRRGRVRFPLMVGDAETLPLKDGCFDVVFCDWGAMTFCDPHRTVPEVARVLRPGGVFAFATASPFRHLFLDPKTDRMGPRLRRDYFALHQIDFPDEVNFVLPYGEWIRLFRENGLEIERLIEPQGGPRRRTTYLTRSERTWSARVPVENLWRLRRRSGAQMRRARPHGNPHPPPRSRASHG